VLNLSVVADIHLFRLDANAEMFTVQPLVLPSTYHPRPAYTNDGQKLPPLLTFNGTILVVWRQEQVDAAIAKLVETSKYGIGFDMEWQPVFEKGKPKNPIALIQLSTGSLSVTHSRVHACTSTGLFL
jgi:hypothetical protein